MRLVFITGSPERGDEVIKLLEMLGGKNIHGLSGKCSESCYTFDCSGEITFYEKRCLAQEHSIFTLDSFYKKYPYKIGDSIKIRGHEFPCIIRDMRWYGEALYFAVPVNEWLTLEDIAFDDFSKEEYFTTYEECLIDININEITDINSITYLLQKLFICRNAYWGSWKPDWTSPELKYVIKTMGNKACLTTESTINCVLAFPTREMRDVFYNNFKELIERTKPYI